MIVDCHVHFGKEGRRLVSRADIEYLASRFEIGHMALFPFGEGDLVAQSEAILDLSKDVGFVLPFLRFNPHLIEPAELDQQLAKSYSGIKLHPRSQNFDPLAPEFEWIWPRLAASGKPVLFHCKSYHFEPMSQPERLFELAAAFPGMKTILGHFAGVNKPLFKEYCEHPNIYVESSIDVTPNAYRDVVEEIGFDRLMFGTDFPFSHPEIELLKLKYSGLKPAARERILRSVAEELFQL